MSIFHATTKSISRAKGHSSTAKAAYITCDKILDNRTGEIHNYQNKKGLEDSQIVLPKNIIKEISAEELWNKAEAAEIRKDGRTAREWVIALPHELNREQRRDLAHDLSSELANKYQVATQYAIHEPSKDGDQRNYHVHILCTTRKIDQNLNLGEKAEIELSNKKCLSLGG